MPSFYRWGNRGPEQLVTDPRLYWWLTTKWRSELASWLPDQGSFLRYLCISSPLPFPLWSSPPKWSANEEGSPSDPLGETTFLILLGKSPAQRCGVGLSKGPNELTWFQNWKIIPDLLPVPLGSPPLFSSSTYASRAESASWRETHHSYQLNKPLTLSLWESLRLVFLFLWAECQSKSNREPQLVLLPLPRKTSPTLSLVSRIDIPTGTGNAKLLIDSLGFHFLLWCF